MGPAGAGTIRIWDVKPKHEDRWRKATKDEVEQFEKQLAALKVNMP